MSKKVLTLVLAIVMAFGMQQTPVSAASCMHEKGLSHGVSIVGNYTTQHMGYTGYYVGNTPIYVSCTVTHEVHRHKYYCTKCYAVVYHEDHDVEIAHSAVHK